MGLSGRHTAHTENMQSRELRHPVKSERGVQACDLQVRGTRSPPLWARQKITASTWVVRGPLSQTRPLPVQRDWKRMKMQERHESPAEDRGHAQEHHLPPFPSGCPMSVSFGFPFWPRDYTWETHPVLSRGEIQLHGGLTACFSYGKLGNSPYVETVFEQHE